MTKKFIVKTTKEFTYDEKGFITKEVITEESYEQEIHTGGIVCDSNKYDWKKITGGNPLTAKFGEGKADTSGITHTTISNKSVSDITNEIKAILERDLPKGKSF